MFNAARIFSQRLICNQAVKRSNIRFYLSSAFNCEEAYNKRLASPYIQKIRLDDIFFEIEHQYQHFGKASPLDIDLFANAITDNAHTDEVEDVIHKLRLSTEAANLFPSTQHAFIRVMLACGNNDELLRILDDRLNYGIFMDDYTCILILNKFLKENNVRDAARVASIQMIQEDFTHPIVKFMSLFACHKFAQNPISWVPPEPEKVEEEEDEDDVIRVRVHYLRNPYFDDHFDLRNPDHLVGKTLWMIGNELPDDFGRSYSLLGYTLHNKWDKLLSFIKDIIERNEKPLVYKDSIALIRSYIDKYEPKQAEEKTAFEKNKEELGKNIEKLEKSGSLNTGDLLSTVEEKMKQAIKEHEVNTINNQVKVYEEWEKHREESIRKHIEQVKQDKILAEIEEAKRKMKESEDELFFFENEDKIDLIIEKKEIVHPIKYKGKIKKKKDIDQEYIPPEIEKRLN